jgi:3-deoxy-D-manno-octulosonic-acid transferase
MANSEHRPRLVHAAVGSLLAKYIRFVGSSSRQQNDVAVRFDEHSHHHPCVVTMWHGQFLLLPLIKYPGFETDVMLARHGDAEILGSTLRNFGMHLIRGAGSAGRRRKDRGGTHAYRAAVQTLREGRSLAMTADVPGGEARQVGLGVVMVARQSGRPILPMAIATSRYVAFNTWSRMTLNLPWSDLGFAIGDAIHVPRDASSEDLEACRRAVEQSLNAVTELAYARAHADPTRATPGLARGSTQPGLRLGVYRTFTSLARPIAPMLLTMRERRGKEEPQRRNERFGQPTAPRPQGRLVWIHAASVGETNAVLPLISALGEQRSSLSFLLTTGTVTSAKLAAERLGPRAIHQYAPLDAPQYVRGFLDHWRPDLAVFTESEIWPNLILETAARDVPLALVNGRMTKRSFQRWRASPGVARPLFSRFSLVLTQNDVLAKRFRTLGATSVVAAGNLKIDTPPPPVDAAALERLKPALGGRMLLVAASTHEGEDIIVADAHRELRHSMPDLCTIIAPRHPERGAAIAELLKGRGLNVAQRSLGSLPERNSDAYIADTIGELGMLYALAPVAFIGGSLVDRGGQNPIEAVRQGAAVITGPHWHNFSDTYRALIDHGAAIVVRSAPELASAAGRLLCDQAELSRMRERAGSALSALSGALPRTVEALLQYLPAEERLARAS